MALTKEQFEKLRETRKWDNMVIDSWTDRRTNQADWKTEIERTEFMYRGNWPVLWPDQEIDNDMLKVANLVQTGMDDVRNLVGEVFPVFKAPAVGAADEDESAAELREAIAMGYWWNEDYMFWLPEKLALDIAGSGAAFCLVWADTDSDYPVFYRLDPRSCYPTIHNGRLIDLLVVSKMKAREARALYEELVPYVEPDDNSEVEVLDFYDRDTVGKLINFKEGPKKGDQVRVKLQPNPFSPVVPVAWAQIETFDNQLHGFYWQIEGIVFSQNKIATQMIDYGDQLIYSPFKARNVANLHEKPGPETIYQLLEGGDIARVEPAGPAPQSFVLLDYLERQGRVGISYPESRSGRVDQSIASGSFVQQTQGNLSSLVQSVHRKLSILISRMNKLAFMVDEKYLNKTKPLLTPMADVREYKPRDAIDGKHFTRVMWGIGAGLGEINRAALLGQDVGLQIISKDTAREQKDYIHDPRGERQKIEREAMQDVFLQRAATESTFDQMLEIMAAQADGLTVHEAAKRVREAELRKLQAAQAPPPEEEEPLAPEAPPAPEQAPEAAVEEEEAQFDPEFQPPPFTNVQVAPPRF